MALLWACEQAPEKVVIESWSLKQPKLVAYYIVDGATRVKVSEERFYQDGTREYIGHFDENGERHGEWKYYYKSGQLWSLGSYINGKKDGKKEVYWPDGTKRYEGQFIGDEKSGIWTFYNPDGTVLQKMDFNVAETEAPKPD